MDYETQDNIAYADSGLNIVGSEELYAMEEEKDNEEQYGLQPIYYTELASYVLNKFYKHRDARRNSWVEDMIVSSARAYNREYGPRELSQMPENGSRIYMPITTTKCTNACSWIRDILQSANQKPYSIEPSPVPELPEAIMSQIEEAFENELQEGISAQDVESVSPQQPAGPEGPQDPALQPPPEGTVKIQTATEKLRNMSRLKNDIQEAIMSQIDEESKRQLFKVERLIDDQLVEGDWDNALAQFIQDFVIYPAAIMKGPAITKEDRVSYVNGKPTRSTRYIFKNTRVSPMDFYPAPEAADINDGDMIEHVRYSRRELWNMKGVEKYEDEYLDKILDENAPSFNFIDTGLEHEKAEIERHGTEFEMNENTFHGLHGFMSVPGYLLLDWGLKDAKVLGMQDPMEEFEVEVLYVNGEVIKCVLNDDPLKRRPYYKACWRDIPGSFWGHSLPHLLNPIQRMCNGVARALADNMGFASGPMLEVYVDRLADAGALEALHPRQILQLKSDPTGSQGRAVNFFSIPSHAQELLGVYKQFEEMADDATGIPRYAYGNEKTGGAASTAMGLSLLLESASKGVKDGIRSIDRGLIVPRIEYQFYWNILSNPDLKYTGDITIVAHGSKTMTMKAAQHARRQEFLQITANPKDQEIMGYAGRADILRIAAEDLGLPNTLIPTKWEMQKKEKEMLAREAAIQEAQANSASVGLQATKYQTDGQKEMHQGSLQIQRERMEKEEQAMITKAQIKIAEAQAKEQLVLNQANSALQSTAFKEEQQNKRTDRILAVDIQRANQQSQDRRMSRRF